MCVLTCCVLFAGERANTDPASALSQLLSPFHSAAHSLVLAPFLLLNHLLQFLINFYALLPQCQNKHWKTSHKANCLDLASDDDAAIEEAKRRTLLRLFGRTVKAQSGPRSKMD